ncbi:MAG: HAD family hydrolase [Fimbriiglobus sp.]
MLTYLDTRGLPWPKMPKVEPVKARPSHEPLPVKAVLWNIYGTLLAVPGGELQFEAAIDFVMDAALDKTIQEFKMWNSMSRKPGAPAAYMKELYKKALTALQLQGSGGEKFPETLSEKIWDDIVKKLQQKDYTFDATLYGGLDDLTKKIAYFFHASIQGCGAYEGACDAIRLIADGGRVQGLLGDGQCFTFAQLQRSLGQQENGFPAANFFPANLRIISAEKRAKKPSDTLFGAAVAALAARGISPSETLHIGSSLTRDIGPAKKHGMRTALFAGDKASLQATGDQLKDPATRPDVLLTELSQIANVLGM